MSDLPDDNVESAYKTIEEFIRVRDAKVLADIQWLNSNSMSQPNVPQMMEPSVPESEILKERDEKVARRNQVLFAVAWFDGEEFRYSDIEAYLRVIFPESFNGPTLLNVTNMITEMTHQDHGLLKRSPTGFGYMLKAPLLRGCLRNMMRRPENGEIVEVGR